MDEQMTFQRYEIKYLLNKRQKGVMLHAMEPYLELDNYGRTSIHNVYYDTDNFRLIRRSLEKPIYKEKIRIRSYGTVTPKDNIYIELKKKYKSIVYKRRIIMREQEAVQYLAGKSRLFEHNQIADEIDYVLKFYQSLIPRMFLFYEREAYKTKEPGLFRVTFDENILWRERDLSLTQEAYGVPLLTEGTTLMEVKTPGGIPLWMVDILTKEKIQKVSFSKYGNAYLAKIRQGERI